MAGPAEAAATREVAVAAAANLNVALDEIAVRFEQRHPGIEVKVTYGSSGNFYAQLSSEAPFDLFLSADTDYPHRLVGAGLAGADDEFVYARGRIVVWVPDSSPLDLGSLGLRAVADPSVRKVAIANPRVAPYGQAAEAALKTFGVYEEVKDRLVLGENIAQAAQFVQSGAADVGILALSSALAPPLRDEGRSWPVPLDAHPPLRQGGVILNWARDREAARLLQDFVTGPEGRAVLAHHGYAIPEE